MSEFSAYVAFNKAANGQTDIKHETRTTSVFDALFDVCQGKV